MREREKNMRTRKEERRHENKVQKETRRKIEDEKRRYRVGRKGDKEAKERKGGGIKSSNRGMK